MRRLGLRRSVYKNAAQRTAAAAERLRGLAEDAQTDAAHALDIPEADLQGDLIKRLVRLLNAGQGCLTP